VAQQSSAVAGKAYRTFLHEGVTYLLSQPLRRRSYQDEMALVLWLRNDPGEFGLELVNRLPASMHAAVWEGCAAANMRGIPSEEEWAAYGASSWKTAFMLWTTLDPKHKIDPNTRVARDTISGVEWCLAIITSLPPNELQELLIKIAYVSQDAALKNLHGRPEPENREGQNQQTETHASTATPPLTDSLQNDTDTDPTK
jgi:hypothetical protein